MTTKQQHMRGAAVALVLGAGLASAGAAQAAVIGNGMATPFAAGSTSFSLAPNAGITLTGTADTFNPVSISTSGTAKVTSLGAPFYPTPQPTSYFTNRGEVSFGSGNQYSAFAAPTPIPFSINDTYVGLSFTDSAGTHYGYIEFNGPSLLAYGYETTPGASIIAGSAFTAPIGTAVPEPASMALLAGGMFAVGAISRRRRTGGTTAA